MGVLRACALGTTLAALSCASSAPAPASRAPARPPAGAAWTYDVVASEGGRELSIEATFPPGVAAELSVDEGAEPFLRDLRLSTETGEIQAEGTSWMVPACAAAGCTLRYRYDLDEAAEALDDCGVAGEQGGLLLSPPSTWLLRPLGDTRARFRLRVTTPEGTSFASGLYPAPDGSGYEAAAADLAEGPAFSAFGALRIQHLAVDGADLTIALGPSPLALGDAAVAGWIGRSAGAVSGYFGRFPVPRALVVVASTPGGRIGYARTLGNGGASIVAPVGKDSPAAELDDDWVMTHEMVHLGFPNLPRGQAWLEEGMATYVEPIARARAGTLSPEKVWGWLVRGLPHGLPAAGDRGLDGTPTWGRTYWGGALFCLLADVEIREKSGGARSLDDALRAILAAGGDVSVRWDLERTLDEGDRATGLTVLRDLHARMGSAPMAVDLGALFAELGVTGPAGSIRFDDSAPLAAIRKAVTRGDAGAGAGPKGS